MFKSLFNMGNDNMKVVSKSKRTSTRGRRKLSKRAKVLNLLSNGASVSWKTL